MKKRTVHIGRGSVPTPDQYGPSLQELPKIQRAAEQATLTTVPGTVLETELEANDGCVVYDVEVASDDVKTHEVNIDAGNGEILPQISKCRSTKKPIEEGMTANHRAATVGVRAGPRSRACCACNSTRVG